MDSLNAGMQDVGFLYNHLGSIITIIIVTFTGIVAWVKVGTTLEGDIKINKDRLLTHQEDLKELEGIVQDHDKDIALIKSDISGIRKASDRHADEVSKINANLQTLLIKIGE